MSYKTGNKQIIISGAMVGIGLVAVALAIFTRLPIGSDFVKALRQGSERRSGARVAAPRADHRSAETVLTKANQAQSEPENPQPKVETKSAALPSSITITRMTEISIGIGKMVLEVGNVLPVIEKGDEVFVCEYLGDTVDVPISATNWVRPDVP